MEKIYHDSSLHRKTHEVKLKAPEVLNVILIKRKSSTRNLFSLKPKHPKNIPDRKFKIPEAIEKYTTA